MPDTPSPSSPAPADCAAQLRQLFPALFGAHPPKPLKLRIQADIQARAPGRFTKPALSAFLRRYTGSTAYLVALARETQRYDLDGAPSMPLSDEHREAATSELARRRALHEERRRLEDEQRRNRATLLRDYETTTLTRANFCALKGIEVDALDELLELARRDAQAMRLQRGPAPRGGRPEPRHAQREPGTAPAPRHAQPGQRLERGARPEPAADADRRPGKVR